MAGRVRYAEGDWFAVPLGSGGFGVGVVARRSAGGVLFGYFFGPARADVPDLDELGGLAAVDADLVCAFGHLGIRQGTWPLIGRSAGWDRTDWPIPPLVRRPALIDDVWIVHYADDPNEVVREERVPAAEAPDGPDDGMMGSGAVEVRLTRLLG